MKLKFYFERRVIIGFVCTLLVLITLGVLSVSSIQRLLKSVALLNHALSVMANADLTLKSIVDTETGARGYVITNDSVFLEPLHTSAAPMVSYQRKLDSLTAKYPLQSKRIDSLKTLIAHELTYTDKLIAARKKDFETARAVVITREGKLITDSIRSLVRRIQTEESLIFRKDNPVTENTISLFQMSFVGLVVACVGIVTYSFFLINRTLKSKNAAEQKNLELNQYLERKVEERTRKLSESEGIYRSLAENMPGSSITVLDREERYILAEGDFLKKMNYKKDEMIGKKISEVITPENYVFYKTVIDRAFNGESTSMERRTLSGFESLLRAAPLRNSDGEIFAVMFILIDITEIKNVQRELATLNSSLEEKVTSRTEQLRELNQELEAFTYSVSHDLRAPLRAISGYAQMLKEDYSPVVGEEGLRITNLIIDSGIRMGKLIDDLLAFSRLGRKEISRGKIDMNALVKDVLSELTPHEVSRQVNIHSNPLESSAGDVSMMRQVWVNLISNALKYTRKKEVAEITISSFRDNGEVCYSISDNGAGFEMQFAGKLFGVFQRLHKVKDFEGTGVGLALTKTIIKKHGGRVWAEGKLNEGAKFYFTLPTNPTNN
jgi:PAS domain S-box-containing protein